MKKVLLAVLLLLVPCIAGISASEEMIPATIVKIINAETMIVNIKSREVPVRLAGVRIPSEKEIEMYCARNRVNRQYLGEMLTIRREAESFLSQRFRAGNVLYVKSDPSQIGSSSVVPVFLYGPDQKLINSQLISEGLSYVHQDGGDPAIYQSLQNDLKFATERKKGLWRMWVVYDPQITLAIERAAQKEVTIMSMNTENLFDTLHDPGKNDYAYLPLSQKNTEEVRAACSAATMGRTECFRMDWNEQRLADKMSRLKGAVLQINNGKGPDILVVQEVENIRVLEQFRKNFLPSDYLLSILIEGSDARGVDVGIISKFPQVGPARLHNIPFSEDKDSRGILEATFLLPDGQLLTVFAIHFPSQFAPVKFRQEAMQYLNTLQKELPAGRISVAAGDCNITGEEAATSKIFEEFAEPQWLVSQKIGMLGVPGTHYYNGKWSFFDIFLLSKNLAPSGDAPWKVIPERIRVANADEKQYFTLPDGTKVPNRYNYPNFRGVSDHFPIVMVLEKRN